MTDSGYEKKDVNLNKIIIAGVLSVIATVVIILLIIDYFGAIKEELVYEMELRPESVALRELRARENEELGNYKLLDADKGIYRIPIKRAMELMADENYQSR